MIRINLLEVRPKSTERLDALLSPGGSSTFISRREGLLGVLFLALTVVILGVLAYRFAFDHEEGDPQQVAAIEPVPQSPEPSPEPPPEPVDPEPAAAPEAVDGPSPEAPAPEETAPEESAAPPAAAQPQPRPAPAPTTSAQASAGASSSAMDSASPLSSIRVTPLADRVDIFLEMANAGEVTSFSVDNPPRVVFDIPNARLQAPDASRTQTVASPLINRVRVAQNRFDPPVVRVVLDVDSFPAAEASTSPAGVSIRVMPAR